MPSNRKSIALALGTAAFLLLALLAGLKFGALTAPAPPAPVDSAPPATVASAGNTTLPEIGGLPEARPADALLVPLTSMQAELTRARNAMARASAGNKGGYVEKARADIDAALSHLDAALAYNQAHPQVKDLPVKPVPFELAAITPGHAAGAPNLRTSLVAVGNAFDALQHAPGGDLGSLRANLAADLRQAASDLVSGINVVNGIPPLPDSPANPIPTPRLP